MKVLKIGLLRLARMLGIFALMRRRTAGDVRILCYHGVMLTDRFGEDSMFFHPGTFARRMESLARLGYRVIPLEDAVAGLAGRRPLPAGSVAITIDDGWYSTFCEMWPVLKRLGMPATLYIDTGNFGAMRTTANCISTYLTAEVDVDAYGDEARALLGRAVDRASPPEDRMTALRRLADLVGFELQSLLRRRAFEYMTPAELRTAAAEGLDVQLHTHNHTIGDHSPDMIRCEVERNRAALAEWLDRDPGSFRHFCYPSGDCSMAAASTLADLDIASATTTEPRIASRGDDPRLLPRLLDNAAWSDVEFEAELCGFGDLVRRTRSSVESLPRRLAGSRRRPTDTAPA